MSEVAGIPTSDQLKASWKQIYFTELFSTPTQHTIAIENHVMLCGMRFAKQTRERVDMIMLQARFEESIENRLERL